MMRKVSSGARSTVFLALVGAVVGTATLAHADDPNAYEDPYTGADGQTYVDEVGDSWPGPPDASDDGDNGQLSPPAPRGFDYRALERAVHNEMNLLRQSPATYADKIAARRSTYRGKIRYPAGGQAILTQEGVAALDEAVEALREAERLPRLAWSDTLNTSANGHAADLNRKNLVGHAGSDGSQPESRVARVGKVEGWVAENIAFGPRTGEDVVIGLIVDDGVADRGHRDVLLKADLFVAGTACGPHPTYGVVCVMNYATRITPIAGEPAAVAEAPVVYDDDNYDDSQPVVQAPVGTPPVWGPPPTGSLAATVDAAPAYADGDDEGYGDAPVDAEDEFVCPFETQPTAPPVAAQPPVVPQRAPAQPQLQQLLDSRYPADHPRNQPPERRQVRRPIMRTEGANRSHRGQQRGGRGQYNDSYQY